MTGRHHCRWWSRTITSPASQACCQVSARCPGSVSLRVGRWCPSRAHAPASAWREGHRGLVLVGARGLEPPTSSSRTTRATYCATPRPNPHRTVPRPRSPTDPPPPGRNGARSCRRHAEVRDTRSVPKEPRRPLMQSRIGQLPLRDDHIIAAGEAVTQGVCPRSFGRNPGLSTPHPRCGRMTPRLT